MNGGERRVAGNEHDTRKHRRIYVDADACPFKDVIVEVASQNGLAVTMVANYNHEIQAVGERVEIVRVDSERDAVDLAIANRVERGDIVVTQDYGLAAIVLGKGARALSPRGKIFDDDNIDSLLSGRHGAWKARRAGRRSRGPSPIGPGERERFRRALERLVGS